MNLGSAPGVAYYGVRFLHVPPGPFDVSSITPGLPIYILGADPRLERDLTEADLTYASLPDSLEVDAVILIPRRPLDQLADVTDRLLGPGGCPWDQAQTHESLKKYMLEEAYEVIDAIDSGDEAGFQEELGDLLLQPVLHAQMKKLAGRFDIDAVAQGITEKLIRRHPHVFGDAVADTPEEVLKNWDKIKQTEKGSVPRSLLAGVPKSMAALLRAQEISKRAVRVGFEWPDIEAVFDKMHEEEAELREAIASGDIVEIESELGDLLFTVVNIARWSGVEAEQALRRMLDRFTSRFMQMEQNSVKPLDELSAAEWESLWQEAKLVIHITKPV
ncbi:hypothetical protein BH11ARM1_BH11ARM1_07230 [soil metagenome]